jgi:Phosphotransferase enzyme family
MGPSGSGTRFAARPAWLHAEDTLVQVARWMRGYHQAVADFIPPPNAAWRQGRLTGFFDWDFAGPATPEWDLALTAFTWVPLHVRYVVAAEGFTDFAATPLPTWRVSRDSALSDQVSGLPWDAP